MSPKKIYEKFIAEYSIPEEIAHSVSHGAGFTFAVVALVLLIIKSSDVGDGITITSTSIYGGSMILLFLSSTLYHAITHTKAKKVLQIIDHCAIYLLIAGSYTPFLLITIKGTLGLVAFITIWSLAVIGITVKIIYFDRFKKLDPILYLVMGWFAVILIHELYISLPLPGLILMGCGGLFYSVGVLFYLADNKIPFNHFIWHLFVIGGTVCHFIAVYGYVL